jgi:uncharacterized membrane protein YGL010W
MALFSSRSSEEWLADYERSHQHPINRRCHTFGIPLIGLSLLCVPGALFLSPLWWGVGVSFTFGWALQFVGHAFEGKPPEFFKDWRFLLVGARWWLWKARGGGAARQPRPGAPR